MSQSKSLVLSLRSEGAVPYWPGYKSLTGSTNAAILLQQIIFRYASTCPDPFYKFKEPCRHELCRQGDSWCEELRFSAEEFDHALRRIGTKITKGVSKAEAFAKTDVTGLVMYWTDADRVTWYTVNVGLADKLLSTVYLEGEASRFILLTENTTEKKRRKRQPSANATGAGAENIGEFSPPKAIRKF
jgi:hypothetical protein